MKRMPMNRKENEQEGGNRERKTFGLFCILTSFLFLFSGTAKADWVKGEGKNAWWFDFGNGDYFKSSWQWIDGNQDGIAECYCFDENGWMYENTTSNNFTETKNNNLVETRNNEENQGNEDFSEKQDEYRADLLRRVNKYREKNGLNTLEENDYLNEMAQIRAEELSVRYSHIRPNGELAMRYGVNGEIGMKGSKTPKDAFLAWKESKQHNEIMLRRDILTFGSGYYVDENGKSYWVILFSTDMNPY